MDFSAFVCILLHLVVFVICHFVEKQDSQEGLQEALFVFHFAKQNEIQTKTNTFSIWLRRR